MKDNGIGNTWVKQLTHKERKKIHMWFILIPISIIILLISLSTISVYFFEGNWKENVLAIFFSVSLFSILFSIGWYMVPRVKRFSDDGLILTKKGREIFKGWDSIEKVDFDKAVSKVTFKDRTEMTFPGTRYSIVRKTQEDYEKYKHEKDMATKNKEPPQ